MTFQPPPPPPGGNPPPPPPPGQWGPPPGGGYGAPQGGFDPKNVNPLDWGIVGAGVLAFIFSFINFYTYSAKGGFSGISVDQSAWSGFLSLLAILLIIVGTALIALDLFAPQVKLPIPTRLAGLGAFALATLLLIIALFTVPDYGGGGPGYDRAVDEGHGFGYWATLLMSIVGLVLSLMRLQQTGGKLPGALGNVPNIGARGPQGGMSGGQPGPGGAPGGMSGGQPGPGGAPGGMSGGQPGPGGAPGGTPPAPPPAPPGYGPPPQP
ncbi:MAG: hypothetical protein ABR571_07675 [Jatrophihabitans sp.]|uniref:hypothetical protein n=1 Tax=Jatrophihabitans sp. TaxID=1932789 RepID=UPI00390F2990